MNAEDDSAIGSDIFVVDSVRPSPLNIEGMAEGMVEFQPEEKIEVSRETLVQLVDAVNRLGETMQWLADGTMNMFTFFNGLGTDVNSLTLPQKLKLLREMIG